MTNTQLGYNDLFSSWEKLLFINTVENSGYQILHEWDKQGLTDRVLSGNSLVGDHGIYNLIDFTPWKYRLKTLHSNIIPRRK